MPKLSIRTKFAVGAVVVFTTTIGAGVIIMLVLQSRQLEKSQQERLDLVSSSVYGGLLKSMLHGGVHDLQRTFAAFGQHRSDATVEVINSDMRVVASTIPGRIGAKRRLAADLPVDGPYLTDTLVGNESMLTRVAPLGQDEVCQRCHKNNGENLGYMVVSMSKRPLQYKIDELRNTLLSYATITLVLLLLASWVALSQLVVRPIRSLAQTMSRARAGDLSVRIDDLGTGDELAWLGENFNLMLQRLSEAREKLDRTYKDRLVRADRFASVGELASGLAHEIKNPLAGLSGALEIFREDLPIDSEKREILDEMQRQIQRLDRAMNDLLRFARPPKPAFAPVQINDVLTQVLSLVRKHRAAANVEIVEALAAKAPLLADNSQLEQVFLNLCLNALQAMSDGGQLTVQTEDSDNHVRVHICDTGKGIDEHAAGSVFKPFFTTKTTGTGLGLAISSRIVADHNGNIDFANRPNGGTCFTVSLPYEQSDDAPAALPSKESA